MSIHLLPCSRIMSCLMKLGNRDKRSFPHRVVFNRLISFTNKLKILDSLSLTVHPVPAPFSTKELTNNKINEGGNNQNDMLFNLGNLLT